MAPGQFFDAPQTISIDGHSIPITMQAECDFRTLQEGVESGLFDVPDEPGGITVPVTVQVMLPPEVMQRIAAMQTAVAGPAAAVRDDNQPAPRPYKLRNHDRVRRPPPLSFR